jgi:hydroxyethylthiazole kinase-like uncharacterized protein yjeF
MPPALVRVVTAAEAAERDRASIAAGTPSRALMQRAGAATASEIALRYRDRLQRGVLVLVGPGNNGGDGWVVARALAATGVRVRVQEVVPTTSDDARAERVQAVPFVELVLETMTKDLLSNADTYRGEGIVVDAVLGTGASGAPRFPLANATKGMSLMRERGAAIVAIDIPTGVDATTGETFSPARADVTFTYGTLKRGHLLARAACGRIVVLDIGLRAPDDSDVTPEVVSAAWVSQHVPEFAPDAHKGTRKKIAIVGGGPGMSGAVILAARGAWRSGVGMVKLVVAEESLASVREAEPQSLTTRWPSSANDVEREIAAWADVVAIGPGLGGGTAGRTLVDTVLRAFPGPVVLDADAINAFNADVNALAAHIMERKAVLTPHAAEFGRLTGQSVDEVLKRRFAVALPVAKHTRAVVLLKGQPTIVTSPAGERLVSASGTPLLASAGSGDVLTGMVATLLAQIGDPLIAAACAAWVHGRAASLAQRGSKTLRGFSLEDVIAQLPRAWAMRSGPTRYPVLYELAPVV